VDQAVLVGVHDGLDAIAQVELAEHPADVGFHGGLGQHEPGGDLGVGQAGRDLGEDLAFPGS
jgi:hypothetical protein